MAFYVGQKVVCVDDAEIGGIWVADAPVEGEIYTITGQLTVNVYGQNRPGLLLSEIKNCDGFLGAYCSTRFRPIIEKSTDAGMAILHEIIDRESHDERKPANAH